MRLFLILLYCQAQASMPPQKVNELLFLGEAPTLSMAETVLVLPVAHAYLSPEGAVGMLLGDDRVVVYREGEARSYDIPQPGLGKTYRLKAFCWDLSGEPRFALVLGLHGRQTVFWGDVHDAALKKCDQTIPDAASFNYFNAKLFFINLKKASIDWVSPENRSGSRKTEPNIYNMKIRPVSGQPIFTVRDANNNRGIYQGYDAQPVWDDPDVDELYPHPSPDGRYLGFIAIRKQEGRYYLGHKAFNAKGLVQQSSFSFVIEENATLREYPRMWLLDEKLYFFTRQVDQLSANASAGLYVLSQDGEDRVTYDDLRQTLSQTSFQGLNLFYDHRGTIEELAVTSIHAVIPYKSTGKTRFAILASATFVFKDEANNDYVDWGGGNVLLMVDRLKHGGG